MTCRQFEELILFSTPGAPLPSDAEAHLAGCAACQRLLAAFAKAAAVEPPSAQQLDAIKASTRSNLAPVKPLPRTGIFVLWFLLIAAAAVAAGISHLGTAGWEALGLVRRAAIYSLLAASFFLLATMLGRQVAPGSRLILRPSHAILAIFAVLAATLASLFQVHPEATFVRTGLFCLSLGIGCASAVGLICWLVLRRGSVLNPPSAGALTGLLSGVAALALLETFCPNPNRYHILAWHLGAVVLSTLGGLAIGQMVDRFRA